MMQDAIKNFSKQFEWEPKMENGSVEDHDRFIVCGMGGSALAADILSAVDPMLDIIVHRDYALPSPHDINKRLIIFSSYSGNTAEVLDAFDLALEHKEDLAMAVLTTGGELLKKAQDNNVSYIQMSDTGIQPRSALGFNLRGLLAFVNRPSLIKMVEELSEELGDYKKEGVELAGQLQDKIPVIYSSSTNRAIAYNWKIKLNETGKVPAFYNVVPELNHNEMTGFDVSEKAGGLLKNLAFVFLTDEDDDKRNQKRFEVLQKLYRERGMTVIKKPLGGEGFAKVFNSLLLADWTAVTLAEYYGHESEQVPMVEEFKKLIA